MAETKKIVSVNVVPLDVLFQPLKFGTTFLEQSVCQCPVKSDNGPEIDANTHTHFCKQTIFSLHRK